MPEHVVSTAVLLFLALTLAPVVYYIAQEAIQSPGIILYPRDLEAVPLAPRNETLIIATVEAQTDLPQATRVTARVVDPYNGVIYNASRVDVEQYPSRLVVTVAVPAVLPPGDYRLLLEIQFDDGSIESVRMQFTI